MENVKAVKATKASKVSKKEKKVKSDYPVYPRAKSGSGVGEMARACIKKGYDFQKTYETIAQKVPDTKFSKKCYYWYRAHFTISNGEVAPAIEKAIVAPAIEKAIVPKAKKETKKAKPASPKAVKPTKAPAVTAPAANAEASL